MARSIDSLSVEHVKTGSFFISIGGTSKALHSYASRYERKIKTENVYIISGKLKETKTQSAIKVMLTK